MRLKTFTILLAFCAVLSVLWYLFGQFPAESILSHIRAPSERSLQTTTVTTQGTTQPPLPPCPEKPPKLVGRLAVSFDEKSWDSISAENPDLEEGGTFSPKECKPKDSVAIIVPYRKSESQLKIFLYYLHPILRRQHITYGIFIIEQDSKSKFNRGMLMNIGYDQARKRNKYACYIFHDIDLIPDDDRNLYWCPPQNAPRHMAVGIDTDGYRLVHEDQCGGVCAFNDDQFRTINGFSNTFFGGAGEDNNLANRLSGYSLSRYSVNIARYRKNKNGADQAVNELKVSTNDGRNQDNDGLSTLVYEVSSTDVAKLYTKINVVIDEAKVKTA